MISAMDHWITVDPKIMAGKPCFSGTRIPVYLVFERLAAGETIEQLREAYPDLTSDHIRAAFRHAAELAREEIGLLG
jgi:uncharacterized protein (DUF433 family)